MYIYTYIIIYYLVYFRIFQAISHITPLPITCKLIIRKADKIMIVGLFDPSVFGQDNSDRFTEF